MRSFALAILCCLIILVTLRPTYAAFDAGSKELQIDGNALITLVAATAQKDNVPNNSYTVSTNLTEITNCTSLDNASSLTQTQLINRLTDSCRYDRLEPPLPNDKSPVAVYARIYIYVLQNLDSTDLQFKMQGLLQLRYHDPRLAFEQYAPQRKSAILGESTLREQIWVPHIFIANEQSSSVLGTNEKDIVTSIQPDGTVIISTRIQATLYCFMNFKKFPFDNQQCSTLFESWMYNMSTLHLYWEHAMPVTLDPQLQLPEYNLDNLWTNETIVISDSVNMRHGALSGNYSSLSFSVQLSREVGYYVLEYFVPSIMIVAISWVTFWLQADQTPARTVLGSSTLLSFITLSQSQEKNLSKVSYVTLSEVWFLVCTSFIFLSLVEFAFVNTIWRRNHNIELKKRKAKYIIKSTITPNLNRRRYEKQLECKQNNSNNNSKFNNSHKYNDNSNTVITIEPPIIITDVDSIDKNNNRNNCQSDGDTPSTTSTLSIEDFASAATTPSLPPPPSTNCVDCISNMQATTKEKLEKIESGEKPSTWSTMTPHETSNWIDRKMRFIFPLVFLIFNALFWTLVYCL